MSLESVIGSVSTWDLIIAKALKANQIKLITYVPDKVLAPLIQR